MSAVLKNIDRSVAVDAGENRARSSQDYHARTETPVRVSSGLISLAFFTVETLALMVAMIATQFFYNIYIIDIGFFPEQAASLGLMTLIPYVFLSAVSGGYDPRAYDGAGRAMLESMRNWLIAFFILGWLGFMLKVSANYSRGVISSYFLLGAGGLLLARYMFLRGVGKLFNSGRLVLHRAIIVSDRNEEGMLDLRAGLLDGGIEPVAHIHVEEFGADGAASLGQVAQIIEKIKAIDIGKRIDSVQMFLPLDKVDLIREIYQRGREIPFPIRVFSKSAFGEVILDRHARFGDYVGFQVQARPLSIWQRLVKRGVDFMGAVVGLLLLSPLMVMVAVAIKLDDGGSVLFIQKRRGQNGIPFSIFKFRTMRACENGAHVVQATRGDHRITKLGAMLRRTSIDELPQLINVLLGQMSLVGPRPHAVAHDHYYGDRVMDYVARQHVLPGITGWAQVNGCRGETRDVSDMEARIIFDVWYAQNWSLWLDLRIIFRTLKMVVSDPNAF